MEVTPSVRSWAQVLKVLTILAMVGLALALAFGIVFGDVPREILEAARLDDASGITGTRRAVIAMIGAVPALALFYSLFQMVQLFTHYAQGDVISRACARRIQNIGFGVIAAMALDVMSRPAQGLVATLVNPPGARSLALTIQGVDLGQILAGGLLITIGWAMYEAARIAEENESFV